MKLPIPTNAAVALIIIAGCLVPLTLLWVISTTKSHNLQAWTACLLVIWHLLFTVMMFEYGKRK